MHADIIQEIIQHTTSAHISQDVVVYFLAKQNYCMCFTLTLTAFIHTHLRLVHLILNTS